MYLKLNRDRVQEILYIFKLRTGYDGSANTLQIRHQLSEEEHAWCRRCIGYTESVKHIINECNQYMIGRDELLRQIKAEIDFNWCRNGMELHKVVLYSDDFQKRLVRLPKEKQILFDE